MNQHVTPGGIAISFISAIPRVENEDTRMRSEFTFYATSAHGRMWIFRYQMDIRGAWLWHMYEYGEGDEFPADKAQIRNSLGCLAPNFTDADIDNLIRKVAENPSITVYALFPGHKDAINRPDFVFMPLTKKVISLLRLFANISNAAFESKIICSMAQPMLNAYSFTLNGKQKELFFQSNDSELGRIGISLRNKGFYMYIQGSPEDRLANLPEFIRKPVATSAIPSIWLKLERDIRNPDGGNFLDKQNLPVGTIKEITPIFDTYSKMVGQQQRLDNMSEEDSNQDERTNERKNYQDMEQRYGHYPE